MLPVMADSSESGWSAVTPGQPAAVDPLEGVDPLVWDAVVDRGRQVQASWDTVEVEAVEDSSAVVAVSDSLSEGAATSWSMGSPQPDASPPRLDGWDTLSQEINATQVDSPSRSVCSSDSDGCPFTTEDVPVGLARRPAAAQRPVAVRKRPAATMRARQPPFRPRKKRAW
jgi:hypothetical protein